MRASTQSFLPGFTALKRIDREHGGEVRVGKRKIARPFDPKQALHVALRSSKARREWSMLHPRHCAKIQEAIHRIAAKHGVRVHRFANVGNHIHILLRAYTRTGLQAFLREMSGGIAQLVTGARKGVEIARSRGAVGEATLRGFWDALAYSRIVTLGRDFENVARYLIKNLFEASGISIARLAREGYRLYALDRRGRILGVGPAG